MCGRYLRRSDKQRIAEAFKGGHLPEDFVLPPDYNVAPTTFQRVIRGCRESGERELVLMRWGLIPNFAKSPADYKGISTINARAESIEKSPTWRVPFQRRRCLVLSDGYYEWARPDLKTKQPYSFMMRDEAPFAFAGLWDAWKEPDGAWLQSFSVVTTEANSLTQAVHSRMPVLRNWPLSEAQEERTVKSIRVTTYAPQINRATGRPPARLLADSQPPYPDTSPALELEGCGL